MVISSFKVHYMEVVLETNVLNTASKDNFLTLQLTTVMVDKKSNRALQNRLLNIGPVLEQIVSE